MIEFKDLRPGMVIRVTFGARGSQRAEVTRVTPAGNVYVRKWRATSETWTKPIRLYPSEFIGFISVPHGF